MRSQVKMMCVGAAVVSVMGASGCMRLGTRGTRASAEVVRRCDVSRHDHAGCQVCRSMSEWKVETPSPEVRVEWELILPQETSWREYGMSTGAGPGIVVEVPLPYVWCPYVAPPEPEQRVLVPLVVPEAGLPVPRGERYRTRTDGGGGCE